MDPHTRKPTRPQRSEAERCDDPKFQDTPEEPHENSTPASAERQTKAQTEAPNATAQTRSL
jgi:hypothetical protein